LVRRQTGSPPDGQIETLSGDELLRLEALLRLHTNENDSYVNGYPDRVAPKRIRIKMLKPDLALALTWWSVSFPSSQQEMVGDSTMNLQKFDDGWKIVASHTSVAGM
jgi:hypothetical protein